jgi:hypothetical protein
VVPNNSPLLNTTLHSSVRTARLYRHKIFSPSHYVITEFDCNFILLIFGFYINFMNLIHKKSLLNIIFSSFFPRHTAWCENYRLPLPVGILVTLPGKNNNQPILCGGVEYVSAAQYRALASCSLCFEICGVLRGQLVSILPNPGTRRTRSRYLLIPGDRGFTPRPLHPGNTVE